MRQPGLEIAGFRIRWGEKQKQQKQQKQQQQKVQFIHTSIDADVYILYICQVPARMLPRPAPISFDFRSSLQDLSTQSHTLAAKVNAKAEDRGVVKIGKAQNLTLYLFIRLFVSSSRCC